MSRTNMAKVNKNYDALIAMAERYGVADNALFVQAARQYATQQKVIEMIQESIDGADDLTSEKTYIKGQTNSYANPMVRELPKHSDAANKTATVLLNIITSLGREQKVGSKLDEFLNEK